MANVGKQFYNVGDAVHLLNDEQMLFVVVGVYSYHVGTGVNQRTEYEYEMLRVLPSTKGGHLITRNQKDIELYARYEDKMWKMALEFIKKDRVKNNIQDKDGIPPFVIMLKEYHEKNGDNESVNVAIKDKMNAKHVVDYMAMTTTVDGCLDALNNLDMLIEMFKDQPKHEDDFDYESMRERVFKKLKRLSKRG